MSVWIFAGGMLTVLAIAVLMLCLAANGWPK